MRPFSRRPRTPRTQDQCEHRSGGMTRAGQHVFLSGTMPRDRNFTTSPPLMAAAETPLLPQPSPSERNLHADTEHAPLEGQSQPMYCQSAGKMVPVGVCASRSARMSEPEIAESLQGKMVRHFATAD